MPLSIGIINLVAAPDNKDRRCLTASSGKEDGQLGECKAW